MKSSIRLPARRCGVALLVAALVCGCSSSRQMAAAPPADVVPAAPAPVPIRVLTRDSAFYGLSQYQLSGDTLAGSGWSEQSGWKRPFEGRLAMDDVDYVEVEPTWTTGKGLLLAGGLITMGFVAAAIVNNGDDRKNFDIRVLQGYVGPPSSGSCPFFYTYDGSDYHFESEGFAGAVFRASEYASYDVLEHLRPVGGRYRLRMTNERPETHYVNEVKIFAVDAPAGATVLPDAAGRFHTLSERVPPRTCRTFKGADALASVSRTDRIYWESDLAALDMARDEDLRDGLVLEFEKPHSAREAKLVVGAVNTTLGVYALRRLFAVKGPNLARWHQQIDRDPVERKRVLDWMRAVSTLHVSLWGPDGWVEQTVLPDVGPMIPKDQVAVLDIGDVAGDRLRVRLESTTDLWRIDDVYVDYSKDQEVRVHELAPVTVTDERGNEVADLLRGDDDRYLVTLRGGGADFVFDAVPPDPQRKRTYILESKGFYLTWTERGGTDPPGVMDAVLSDPLLGSRFIMPGWKQTRIASQQ